MKFHDSPAPGFRSLSWSSHWCQRARAVDADTNASADVGRHRRHLHRCRLIEPRGLFPGAGRRRVPRRIESSGAIRLICRRLGFGSKVRGVPESAAPDLYGGHRRPRRRYAAKLYDATLLRDAPRIGYGCSDRRRPPGGVCHQFLMMREGNFTVCDHDARGRVEGQRNLGGPSGRLFAAIHGHATGSAGNGRIEASGTGGVWYQPYSGIKLRRMRPGRPAPELHAPVKSDRVRGLWARGVSEDRGTVRHAPTPRPGTAAIKCFLSSDVPRRRP